MLHPIFQNIFDTIFPEISRERNLSRINRVAAKEVTEEIYDEVASLIDSGAINSEEYEAWIDELDRELNEQDNRFQ